MCGIAGFLGPWGDHELKLMHAQLRHRGPDAEGFFYDRKRGVGLAHARLSIIDVAGGQQPLESVGGRVRVIFNGEIYNHKRLREELETRGYRFRSGSDGEVIGPLYLEYGLDFVKQLRGMFAIAIWDASQNKLVLARDRFGIKPIYYRRSGEGVLFASEAKSILAVDPRRELDPQALHWYLSFRYVPEDLTMFAGVQKVLPGHVMEVTSSGTRTSPYWNLREQVASESLTEGQWVDELRERLKEAVTMHLMSDVPLGAFLSGGLDSSSIVSLMTSAVSEPIQTFSFGVAEGWHNEAHYAEIVAEALGTDHHPLTGDLNDSDLLGKIIWHLDEPLADTAVIPTYLLSALTRRHVTVALTGEGADELLGGYEKYKILVGGDMASRLVPAGPFVFLGDMLSRWEKPHRALRYLAAARDRARSYMELVSVFNEREKSELLSAAGRALISGTDSGEGVVRRILAHANRHTDYLNELMHIDVQTWLPNDVLLKADKMSMAHGLEARVPFLDHEFAEFCAKMPAGLKIRRGKEKYVLRRSMEGILPPEIVSRKKHGFTVPLTDWLTGDDATGPLAAILNDDCAVAHLFDKGRVRRLLRRDVNNEFVRRQVFCLKMLQDWSAVFLDA